jgi:hypothetical protein
LCSTDAPPPDPVCMKPAAARLKHRIPHAVIFARSHRNRRAWGGRTGSSPPIHVETSATGRSGLLNIPEHPDYRLLMLKHSRAMAGHHVPVQDFSKPPSASKKARARAAPDRPPQAQGWNTTDEDEIALRRWRNSQSSGHFELAQRVAAATTSRSAASICIPTPVAASIIVLMASAPASISRVYWPCYAVRMLGRLTRRSRQAVSALRFFSTAAAYKVQQSSGRLPTN